VFVHKKHETERETDISSPLYEKANTTVFLLCHVVSRDMDGGRLGAGTGSREIHDANTIGQANKKVCVRLFHDTASFVKIAEL
jgi:hypothetical protein